MGRPGLGHFVALLGGDFDAICKSRIPLCASVQPPSGLFAPPALGALWIKLGEGPIFFMELFIYFVRLRFFVFFLSVKTILTVTAGIDSGFEGRARRSASFAVQA